MSRDVPTSHGLDAVREHLLTLSKEDAVQAALELLAKTRDAVEEAATAQHERRRTASSM